MASGRAEASFPGYERAVRAELGKKIGKGSASSDVKSQRLAEILRRCFRASVHPVAAAGVITIDAGLAPERAPAPGLCCGQK